MKGEKYIRVGTTYYKIMNSPPLSGDFRERQVVWSHKMIKHEDYEVLDNLELEVI